MQVLCGLQVVFFLFNCQTPETILSKQASTAVLYEFLCMAELGCKNVEFAQICLLNTLQMRYNLVFDTF